MGKPAKIAIRVILVSLTIVVLGIAGLAGLATYMSNSAISKASVAVEGQIMGNPEGTLTVVEFVDYRCHYCPIMNKTLTEALEFEDDIKVIIRPVGWVDDMSKPIGLFVLATSKQGKSVELHKRLMDLAALPDLDVTKSIAQSIGVDVAKAEQDAKTDQIAQMLQDNQDYVMNAGFQGIPALIIGGWRYQPDDVGMKSVNNLRIKFSDSFKRLKNEK
ncbi:MAG: DsbA family protein [Alphaproteobacteria bacterium]|nr:DsbA family protein [Alphaproteobacteria bacterium]MCB1550468.1 DsbA family protein [Alphaproteobacteria bacterium]MCB9985963.1 DsbA family protein [Micavibrio sp.]HPQ50404.1 DsbA family protein [Alphaproteobacteria bacterium]HRK96882.1 DsbA family protein [Alphaproteobacteria bacterium]